jgi:hypothetical protein
MRKWSWRKKYIKHNKIGCKQKHFGISKSIKISCSIMESNGGIFLINRIITKMMKMNIKTDRNKIRNNNKITYRF